MRCDNCYNETEETRTIKWPGLDTELQYEEFCQECFTIWCLFRRTDFKQLLSKLKERRKNQ